MPKQSGKSLKPAILGDFEPSTGKEDYLNPAGSKAPMTTAEDKWTSKIDAVGLQTLSALAKDIDSTIESTIKHVARGQIKIGKLLVEARLEFHGDKEFGQWRKECTNVKSKQQASYLMQVSEKFGNVPKLVEGVSFSVLRELVTAPQSYIDDIEAKVDAGEPTPGAHAVRAEVKQAKGTGPMPGPKTKIPPVFLAKANKPKPVDFVQQELPFRVEFFEGTDKDTSLVEKAYILFGLDPDPQVPPHPDVLTAIYEWFVNDYTGDQHHIDLLKSARDLLDEDRESFND